MGLIGVPDCVGNLPAWTMYIVLYILLSFVIFSCIIFRYVIIMGDYIYIAKELFIFLMVRWVVLAV